MKVAIEKGLYFLLFLYLLFMIILIIVGLTNKNYKEIKLVIRNKSNLELCDSCQYSINDYAKINDNM